MELRNAKVGNKNVVRLPFRQHHASDDHVEISDVSEAKTSVTWVDRVAGRVVGDADSDADGSSDLMRLLIRMNPEDN